MKINRRERTSEYYLSDTHVENMFINEFMPVAPGEYVKVYLFALMYADLGMEMSSGDIAKQLGMDEEDVLKAWSYWEKMGVIRKIPGDGGSFDYTVEFTDLKAGLYGRHAARGEVGKPSPESDFSDILSDGEIRKMYGEIEKILGRPVNGSEMKEIAQWIGDLNASVDMIVHAFKYCREIKKDSVRYVAGVIRGWISKGLSDKESIDRYLEENSQRMFLYRRVFKALGFRRNPTEEEQRRMDGWFDDMGYGIDVVLEACRKTSGISSPNINYVDAILKNWKNEGLSGAVAASVDREAGSGDANDASVVTVTDVMRYYEYILTKEQDEAKKRCDEVYSKVPRVKEIDEELNNLSVQASRLILMSGGSRKESTKKIREQSDELMREKAVLMTENNFELDYMEIRYRCDICRDSGVNDNGERCRCFPERAVEAAEWKKNQK